MTSMAPQPAIGDRERPQWTAVLRVTEMWASLAIAVMWIAVLCDAVWGPDIVRNSAGGGSSSVPSAVAVALFACIATWTVAKYGFRRSHDRA